MFQVLALHYLPWQMANAWNLILSHRSSTKISLETQLCFNPFKSCVALFASVDGTACRTTEEKHREETFGGKGPSTTEPNQLESHSTLKDIHN